MKMQDRCYLIDGRWCDRAANPLPLATLVYRADGRYVYDAEVPDANGPDQAPPLLPTDSKARKEIPLFDFLRRYFPRTFIAMAKLSYRANQKHNPGEVMHWSREKSADHENCTLRHMLEGGQGHVDPETGELYEVAAAWRACAVAELALERQASAKP